MSLRRKSVKEVGKVEGRKELQLSICRCDVTVDVLARVRRATLVIRCQFTAQESYVRSDIKRTQSEDMASVVSGGDQ